MSVAVSYLAWTLAELGHEVAASCARLDEALATARMIACDVAVLDINPGGRA